MLATVGMWTLAFGLTLAEEFIAARRTQAFTMQRDEEWVEGGRDRGNRARAWRAVRWGGLFEFVLCLDIWFISKDYWLAVPIVLGAMVGAWVAVRRQRGTL